MDIVSFSDRNILIVEDEYFAAVEMADAVRKAGGTPLGPVPDVESALAIVASGEVDAAILDIRLGSENSFPVAEALRAKGVPVVFVTGYDDWFLPNDLDDVPIYRKPADPENVVRILFEARKDQS